MGQKKIDIGNPIILINQNEISITNYSSSSVYKIISKEDERFAIVYQVIDKDNHECKIEIMKSAWLLNITYPNFYFQLELSFQTLKKN